MTDKLKWVQFPALKQQGHVSISVNQMVLDFSAFSAPVATVVNSQSIAVSSKIII